MRIAYAIKHAIKIRLYPNKTQQKWIDTNLQNAIDFHNYLLENIYYSDMLVDEDTGEEIEKDDLINWNIINNKYGLTSLQSKFHYALMNVPEDKLPHDMHGTIIHTHYRDLTIAHIYDQVRNDVRRNFTTFYRDGKGKPRFKSRTGRVSFRMPQGSRDINIQRRKTELNHGTDFDFKISNITPKRSSKLSHNIGWLHIPSCGTHNPEADDFIKCFCPCNIEKENISSVTFIREATGKYYATLVLRYARAYLSKKNAVSPLLEEKEVGIDMNVSPKTRIVTSSFQYDEDNIQFVTKHEVIEAPTPYKDYFSKLRKEQRQLSRKVKFSKNYFKQKRRLAKTHKKVANIRLNFNRQVANKLTTEYQSIAIEDLSISQMKRGQPRWFQKLYNDANLYQLRQCIHWSCLKAGRTLWYVSPEHTSKTCNDCGYVNHDLKLGIKQWTCPICGIIHHRDKNAADNIYDMVFQQDKIYDWDIGTNYICYDAFEERKPVTNQYFLEKLSEHIGEEVTTVSA